MTDPTQPSDSDSASAGSAGQPTRRIPAPGATSTKTDLPMISGPPPGSTGPLGPLPGFEDPAAPSPGTVPHVEGYQVISLIGQGAMGAVWNAIQLGTHRPVAIKFLPAHLLGSDRERHRFERGVELASRLKHPHIVDIYDSGTYRGDYYCVMEFIDGQSLDAYVKGRGLAPADIVRIMAAVCRAVEHAHQFGVIHRDLKPSNIMVTADGQPHIVDFGLATACDEADPQMSRDGQIPGTWLYMAPEQAASRRDLISTRSDVYSLGVILYKLLTGKYTHDYPNDRDIPRIVAEEEVVAPGRRNPARPVGAGLESILLKALHHNPQNRYASAGDLAHDLENYPDGPLLVQPRSSRETLQRQFRQYYAPIAIAATLGALILILMIARQLAIHSLNIYSLYDLAAFLINFPLAVMFLVAYFVMGKREVELLFGVMMLLISVACVVLFLEDNLVPDGALALDFRGRASANLTLLREAFLLGLTGIAVQIHFLLRYCGLTRWSGLRIVCLYVAVMSCGAIIFSSSFLSLRNEPLAEKADWTDMVPWTPTTGPLVGLYLTVWVVAQAASQIILYQRKRRGGILPSGPLSQIDVVRLGLGVQAAGVLLDIVLAAIGWGGFSLYPLTSVVTGLIYTVALVREHLTSDLFPSQISQAAGIGHSSD